MPCDGKQESEFPSAMIAYAYPTFYWGKTKQNKNKEHVAKARIICLAESLHCNFQIHLAKR